MRDFRRSVFRVLFGTAALLFIAWAGMKIMLYRGDWEKMIRDGQDFLRKTGITEFVYVKLLPFFRKQVLPRLEGLIDWIRNMVPRH